MKNFKFKIWLPELKYMASVENGDIITFQKSYIKFVISVDGSPITYVVENHAQYNKIIPLLFTGKYDCNNIEIFDRDILKIKRNNKSFKGYVYAGETAHWSCVTRDSYIDSVTFHDIPQNNITKLGNCLENFELLPKVLRDEYEKFMF